MRLECGIKHVVCNKDIHSQMQFFCWIFGSRRSLPLKAEDYTFYCVGIWESGISEISATLESLVDDRTSAGKSVVGALLTPTSHTKLEEHICW